MGYRTEQYTWSGLFSGTEDWISGTVPPSGGELSVAVVDNLGAQGFASLFVTYDPNNQDYCQ